MKEMQKQPEGTKHVPIIYDVIGSYDGADEFDNGRRTLVIFIIMEYFHTDLKKLIESDVRYLQPNQILRIMHEALNSLRFIHQCNVVHRDIKPANIFVTKDL